MIGAALPRYYKGAREAVDIAGATAGAITVLFLTLYVFSPLPEPWRAVMGIAAFVVALLTIARYGWNMLGAMRRHEEIMDILKRYDAKLDAILKAQSETNRLIKEGHDEIIRLLRKMAGEPARKRTV